MLWVENFLFLYCNIPAMRQGETMFRDEREFVRWLRHVIPQARGNLKLGIGDDAALVGLGTGRDLILTTDLSNEGVHFSRAHHPPRAVGHRALARSLSDIAAMGGTPRFALISLALSTRIARVWVKDFFAGVVSLAKQSGVTVIGGDTSVAPGKILIDIILCGEVSRGRALLRSGARVGDQIFVSGRLGLSALGLRLLKSRGGRTAQSVETIEGHLYPQPRCALGRFLSRSQLASAAIDVSDGLSTDLGHMCDASRVGARVWENLIPGPDIDLSGRLSIAGQPKGEARPRELSPRDLLDLALHGGEDYELLFTVSPRKVPRIPRRFQGTEIHRIGEVVASKGVRLLQAGGREEILLPQGWDHFRNKIT